MKILMNDKSRGLQIPNLRLCHDAICLSWIRDWITLENRKLHNLEGFNKRHGWHGYLYYNKVHADKMFQHHYVRNALLSTWQRYVKRIREKQPLWISPLEVITTKIRTEEDTQLIYRHLTERKVG